MGGGRVDRLYGSVSLDMRPSCRAVTTNCSSRTTSTELVCRIAAIDVTNLVALMFSILLRRT